MGRLVCFSNILSNLLYDIYFYVLGALAIMRALISLNKHVTLLTDECNEEVLLNVCANSGIQSNKYILESFPGRNEGFDLNDLERLAAIGKKTYMHTL
jgi:hypothetical protein